MKNKQCRIDWRLLYVNIQDSERHKNIIGKERKDEMWIPYFTFDNSVKEAYIKNDELSSLTIMKRGLGSQKLNSFLQEDFWYNGAENSLVYSRNYKMDFECEFNQLYFPFDTQTCSIQVNTYCKPITKITTYAKKIILT
jgi:hypothetical protein